MEQAVSYDPQDGGTTTKLNAILMDGFAVIVSIGTTTCGFSSIICIGSALTIFSVARSDRARILFAENQMTAPGDEDDITKRRNQAETEVVTQG